MINKLIIISLLFLFNSRNAFASFGNTCDPLVLAPSDNYLQINSAYGYLIDNIDMTSYVVDPCNRSDEQIKFCLKMPAGSSTQCSTTITMNVGDKKTVGTLAPSSELGRNVSLKNIVLSAVRINDSICLTIPTSRGPLAVGCKITTVAAPTPPPTPPMCNNLGPSCYNGYSKSQSLLNFTGVAVQCLKESLDQVFYKKSNCVDPDSIQVQLLTPFPVFQEKLKTAIRAALILYIVFFGIKVALEPQSFNLNTGITFLVKAVLVMYFSVGLGPVFYQDGKPTTRNGMLEHVLPTLTAVTPEFAQIVFNAGGAKGLCQFDSSKYENGFKFYGIWDAIDCRIGYYFGVSLLYDISDFIRSSSVTQTGTYDPASSSPVNLGPAGSEGLESLKSPLGFRFFTVLFGFFMAGNIIVVAAGLAFGIVFISVMLHFLSSYLVCLITLYTMAYISPIFIPMVLFERTKSYYDAWLKILISCALQPAVLAGFVALLLTMYDTAIYKNCLFKRHDYTMSARSHDDLSTETIRFSTFEIREPNSDPEQCRNSPGYKLLKYYIGQGWEKINVILFPIYYIRDIFNLLVDLLYVMVFTVIFYFFSKSMSQFAADITNGPAMNAVTTGPGRVVDAIRSAAAFLANAAQASQGKPPTGGGNEGGKERGGISQDTASVGGGGSKESSDTASTGKGGN